MFLLILLRCNIEKTLLHNQCQKRKKSISAFNRENSIYEVNMVGVQRFLVFLPCSLSSAGHIHTGGGPSLSYL